jgi:hypothetical protein
LHSYVEIAAAGVLCKKKIQLKKEGKINIYGIEYETYPNKVVSALNTVLKVLQIADLLAPTMRCIYFNP